MLYRAGGAVELQDGLYDTRIVHSEDEEREALAEGWCLTPADARAADEPQQPPGDDEPPTREELEAKARELGLRFDGRWGDRRLADAIAEKLREG